MKSTLIIFFLSLISISNKLLSENANPNLIQVTLKTGETIELKFNGGPERHWLTTIKDEYTVIWEKDKYGEDHLMYAKLDQKGNLISTGTEVNTSGPPPELRLKKNIVPKKYLKFKNDIETDKETNKFKKMLKKIRENQGLSHPSAKTAPTVLNNLVILMRFSDETQNVTPIKEDFENLMNKIGGNVCQSNKPNCVCPSASCIAPTGSIKDFYLLNSENTLEIQSTVTDWIDITSTRTEAADGNYGLTTKIHASIVEALTKADEYIDFRDFDQDHNGVLDTLTVVHSGYGAEWGGFGSDNINHIWSHQWSLSIPWTSEEGVRASKYNINPARWGTSDDNIGHIGVFTHELAHVFGLPDLYSTIGDGSGISSLGLMCNAWGVDGSQYYPPSLSAWSKTKLNWTSVYDIKSDGIYQIDSTLASKTYKISNGFPDKEYLLIENRQPKGYDKLLPKGGLAIYHIDENVTTNNKNAYYPGRDPLLHYKVAAVQADGQYNFEKAQFVQVTAQDFWVGSSLELSDNSTPSLLPYSYINNSSACTGNKLNQFSSLGTTMTFQYSFGSDTLPIAKIQTSLIAADGAVQVNFDGTKSIAPCGATISDYTWDFGDGTFGNGATPSHFYTSSATYNISLKITTSSGLQDIATASVQIVIPNKPTATMVVSPPTSTYSGTQVTFDASSSIGTGLIYSWNFGDGTSGSGKIIAHTYTVSGTYNVILTVTDSIGATDSTNSQLQIVVQERPIAAIMVSPPTSTPSGTQVTFDASNSTGKELSYSWNFGDGTSGSGKILDHVYKASKKYKVTLTVTDNLGRKSSTSLQVQIIVQKKY